jgi:hypothetical protein
MVGLGLNQDAKTYFETQPHVPIAIVEVGNVVVAEAGRGCEITGHFYPDAAGYCLTVKSDQKIDRILEIIGGKPSAFLEVDLRSYDDVVGGSGPEERYRLYQGKVV